MSKETFVEDLGPYVSSRVHYCDKHGRVEARTYEGGTLILPTIWADCPSCWGWFSKKRKVKVKRTGES